MADQLAGRANKLTYIVICLLGFLMMTGSLLLKINFSDEATQHPHVIKYPYSNIGDDPMRKSFFRNITITFENVKSLLPKSTKDVRIVINRTAENASTKLEHGKVFSVVIEDMAKFKSVLFDYESCVIEKETTTDILLFLFIKREDELTLRVMIVNIDRETDYINIIGKEVSANDLVTGNLGYVNDDIKDQYIKILMRKLSDGYQD